MRDTAAVPLSTSRDRYPRRDTRMQAEIGVREWPLGVWKRIAEPRVQRVTFLAVYVLHVVAGIALATVQPAAANYEFGQMVTFAWAGFFILGGSLGAISVLPGWNYVERVGVLSLMFAIALCSLFIAFNPWSPAGLEVVIWALVTGWIVILVYRLWEIRGYAIAPK